MNRVLIFGASPDPLNTNAVMRHYVVEGFAEALGENQVRQASLENAKEAFVQFSPSIVLVFGSCMPDEVNYSELRYLCDCNGTALAFWLHDDPYEIDCQFKVTGVADFIFSNDRWSGLHYDSPGRRGKKVHHLPMAANRRAHFREIRPVKSLDLFFCGVAFPNRIQLMRDLAGFSRSYRVQVLGDQWPQEPELSFCVNQRVPNEQVCDLYGSSVLTLNLGRHFDLANRRYQLASSTPGPRTFETAMAGGAQAYFVESLEIEEYFVPGEEILLFDSVQDLKAQLDEAKSAPEKTLKMAERAQQRALRDHTYAARARTILEVIG